MLHDLERKKGQNEKRMEDKRNESMNMEDERVHTAEKDTKGVMIYAK